MYLHYCATIYLLEAWHGDSKDGKHLRIGTLDYVDDVVMVSSKVSKMTRRVTRISVGSRNDGDMYVNVLGKKGAI